MMAGWVWEDGEQAVGALDGQVAAHQACRIMGSLGRSSTKATASDSHSEHKLPGTWKTVERSTKHAAACAL